MSCNSRFKNAHYKSAQNAYNNTPQTFVAAGTPVNVLGILNTDTGCSLDTVAGGFVVNNSGLYRISYDHRRRRGHRRAESTQRYRLAPVRRRASDDRGRQHLHTARRDYRIHRRMLQRNADNKRGSGRCRGHYQPRLRMHGQARVR